MPPKKKKGGKGKGKKGQKETSPKEQELQKFKIENELLKLEVAKQIGVSRRAKSGTVTKLQLRNIILH